jgi:hypothetical protein
MATNPLQQAATRRKLIYFGAIIALFGLSLVWRGKQSFQVPLSDESRVRYMNQRWRGAVDDDVAVSPAPNPVASAADWLYSRTIERQSGADGLDIRELDQGDPELAGSIARQSLIGLRGFVVAGLWRSAIEKFKRNEWQEFETRVRAVTRLQPNFTTPWIYQSWNISYNVSVESERINDMYYYIARGIELLSEGERLNRDSPDMRYQIGFYYQNKFGVSDKVTVLRSLFQLSCVKPNSRNPNQFRNGGQINTAAFRTFVKNNPQLVRRLREKLNYTRPEQVVQFLDDNQRIPTRYNRETDELVAIAEQFPALPPWGNINSDEPGPKAETTDTFDAFDAARSWYAYSQVPLPPTDSRPSETPRLQGNDLFKYRIPKQPMLIIFRQAPARSQTSLAERMQKEGWIDKGTTWNPDERSDTEADRWFGNEETNLTTPASSREGYQKAYNMWFEHGGKNGLRLDAAELARLQTLAIGVPDDYNLFHAPDEILRIQGLTRERVDARAQLRFYDQNKNVTNFDFFLAQSNAEREQAMAKARVVLWDAEQAQRAGDKPKAIKLFADGINQFRQVLVTKPEYHRIGATRLAEENLLEYQVALIRLIEQDPKVDKKARDMALALRSIIPGADEESLKQSISTDLANREAGIMVTLLDPRVNARADEILRLNHPDRTQEKVYTWIGPEGKPKLMLQLVVEKDYKWLWEFMSETSTDDSNRWISDGTRAGMAERLKLPMPQSTQPQMPPQTPAEAPQQMPMGQPK